jgi:lipid A 4'-phosphatase
MGGIGKFLWQRNKEAVRTTPMMSLAKSLISLICRPAVWIPLVVLLALTTLFRCTNLDQTLVRLFFAGNATSSDIGIRFPFGSTQPWQTLYRCGVYPALILGIGGIVVWIVSFFWTKLESWRDPGLFFFLVLIVGPLILVNCIFKPYWSRPRPHATQEFGGPREFVPVWQRGLGEADASFPSGHAAMGFYLMTPAFLCYRRRLGRAAMFLAFGIVCGLVIGTARVVAGGHFPSDVLWAGGVVYFTALAIAAPFRFGQERCSASVEQ